MSNSSSDDLLSMASRSTPQPAPHSAAHFGRQRDFWWNADFLDLMAARWDLGRARSLADIGCGVGHWHRLLLPHLAPGAKVTGVDREKRWLAAAEVSFRNQFPTAAADKFATVAADALSLPLPSGEFDVVTCQTLLMHLRDPLGALREMVRIAAPGGIVIAVEPNNLPNCLSFSSLTWSRSNAELVRRYEFWLCYHRGKIANGEGDDTLGDVLPGYFSQVGLSRIEVHKGDKAASLFPPYETEEQQVILQQTAEWRDSQTGPWDLAALRRHVLAGGGTEDLFDQTVEEMRRTDDEEQAAIRAGRFCASSSGTTFLVSGRKL